MVDVFLLLKNVGAASYSQSGSTTLIVLEKEGQKNVLHFNDKVSSESNIISSYYKLISCSGSQNLVHGPVLSCKNLHKLLENLS